jgi:hypothetical protein
MTRAVVVLLCEGAVMLMTGTWHLILAGMWLVLGVAILITDAPNLRLTRFGLDISSGWIALLFAAFSALRWWSFRSAYQRRRAAEEMRRHRPARGHGRPEPERNPDFIFDEPPPEKPV